MGFAVLRASILQGLDCFTLQGLECVTVFVCKVSDNAKRSVSGLCVDAWACRD